MATDIAQVRLLVNDTDASREVFSDPEIETFLEIEGGSVKRAAAQAIDTIADDEALTSKVIKDHDLSTDGAKLADALRKRATALREQALRDESEADEGAYFEVVTLTDSTVAPVDVAWWP